MLFVKRVPGAITLSVHSEVHSFDHRIINMAHNVNQLSFGEPLSEADAVSTLAADVMCSVCVVLT